MSDTSSVEIRRTDLHQARLAKSESPKLSPGQVRLAIDTFGITANNITYAAFGDRLEYWSFFPAPGGTDWGVVPVWGFADVAESTVDELAEGERIYGYLPMATELIVEPIETTPGRFTDNAKHRRALPALYNRYSRCAADPSYDPTLEDAQILLRPLFSTSFLIDDFLAEAGFFGAEQIVLTSASSKTAFGTAHLLHARDDVDVVGLTSATNVAFVTGLGCYDQVLTYEDVGAMSRRSAVSVDFAGNASVIRAIHEHLGDELMHSAVIGGTHWDSPRDRREPLPGPQREFFFAPTQAERRAADWGTPELINRIQTQWDRFVPSAEQWLDVKHSAGLESAITVYSDILAGQASPSVASVISTSVSEI